MKNVMSLSYLVLVVFVSLVSSQSIPVKGQNYGDCSISLAEVRKTLLGKIGDLQKELSMSVALLRSELNAMRKSNEAGFLSLKNFMLAQAVESKGGGKPLVSTAGSRIDSLQNNLTKEIRNIEKSQKNITSTLTTNLLSKIAGIGRKVEIIDSKLPNRTTTIAVGAGTCSNISRTVISKFANFSIASRQRFKQLLKRLVLEFTSRLKATYKTVRSEEMTLLKGLLELLEIQKSGKTCADVALSQFFERAQETEFFKLLRGMKTYLGNVALLKPAKQSSTWVRSPRPEASKAVDGNTSGRYLDRTCSETRKGNRRHWWAVDLQSEYPIHSVALWNKDCCKSSLRSISVWVSSVRSTYNNPLNMRYQKLCARYPGPATAKDQMVILNCNGRVGRYVTVLKTHASTLSLCEVQVRTEMWSIPVFNANSMFTAVSSRDLDIGVSGTDVGKYPFKLCEAQCVLKVDTCNGFHVTSDGRCYLFYKSKESWSEKFSGSKQVKVWSRKSGGRNPKCNHKNYPSSLGRSRYRVERRRLSWMASMKRCNADGGKLLEVSSEGERRFIHSLIRRKRAYKYVHIGLYQPTKKFEPDGGWYWYASNDEFRMSNRWLRKALDNYKNAEDYGMIYVGNGLFNDIAASKRYSSVCECFVI